MKPNSTLQRFRMVKVSPDIQQAAPSPDFICADPEGLPFGEGQAFYVWLIDKNGCQPVTATTYLKAVLQFLTFLWFRSPPLHYTAASITDLRESIEAYLRTKLTCVIRPHREGNLLITHSKTVTPQTVRLYLTAVKRFYDYLIWTNKYPTPNPLGWEKWQALRDQTLPATLPSSSGWRAADIPTGRMPSTYFCVVADEWKPKIIEDPGLPQQLLQGMSHQRDQIIVRMLFESGARISEILSLTVDDWHQLLGRRHGALTTNKGSWGQRVKEVWWSSETSQQLRLYLNGDRRRDDPFGRRLEELSETDPLFIAKTGRAYRYPAFYYHWGRACARQGLNMHPHQTRHWFVTMALRRIEALPDETQREAYRQGLIAYMHWKSSETIQAYDHHLHLTDFNTIHLAIEQLVQVGQDNQVEERADTVTPETMTNVPPQTWERLCQLFDEREAF